jgi:HD-GYP domain-containing protein (c-di-GMP phosphodiesterase class II)
MGLAAAAIGFLVGGGTYLWGTFRAEYVALDRAEASAQHFETAAMQMALESGDRSDHEALRALLDNRRFIGLRIFRADRSLIFEGWSDIHGPIVRIAESLKHPWPGQGGAYRRWIDTSDGKLIQVVLPLRRENGAVIGFVEAISLLDREELRAQRNRVLGGAWGASLSVLVTVLLLYPLMVAMLNRSNRLSRQLLDSNLSLVRSLGNAIAKRDSGTDEHNYRVTCYAVELAEALDMAKGEIAELVVGAFLHDVGKIGIPDRILLKPGKLSDEEFLLMQTHVEQGIEIVEGNIWLSGATKTIRHHHERFDGTGYPDRLRGEDIPLAARVFAVVDVFDALTSTRPYKQAIPLPDAVAMLDRGTGTHFDPKVIEAFRPVAQSLYTKIYCASSSELRAMLQSMLRKYFGSHVPLSVAACAERCDVQTA